MGIHILPMQMRIVSNFISHQNTDNLLTNVFFSNHRKLIHKLMCIYSLRVYCLCPINLFLLACKCVTTLIKFRTFRMLLAGC